MKTRNGFVSNSSSSSFVVVLPDDFDISLVENKLDKAKKFKLMDKVLEAICELKKTGETGSYIFEESCRHSIDLPEILSDYIVLRIDGGPDDESLIHLISNDKIDNIRKVPQFVFPQYLVRDDGVKFYRNDDGTYSMKPLVDTHGAECITHKYTLNNLLRSQCFKFPEV